MTTDLVPLLEVAQGVGIEDDHAVGPSSGSSPRRRAFRVSVYSW